MSQVFVENTKGIIPVYLLGDELRRRAVIALAMCGLRPDVTDEQAEADAHVVAYRRGGNRAVVELLDERSDEDLAQLREERRRRLEHGAAETEALVELERRIRHLELMEKWPRIPVSSVW